MELDKKLRNYQTAFVIFLLLFVASACLNVYFMNNSPADVKEETTTNATELNLNQDYISKAAELERYKGINDSLDKVITSGEVKIGSLEDEIKALQKVVKKDNSQKMTLEAKIKERDKLVEEYLERIDQVVTENNLLKEQNDALTKNLTTNQEKVVQLEGKVNTASVLKTEYVKISPMKNKFMSDKLQETVMARKVVSFKVCFTVLENQVASKGDKMVYLRIIAPDGKVVGTPDTGSAKFKTAAGTEELFTLGKSFSFDGMKSEQCLAYEVAKKNTFIPGDYTFEIYVDGNLTSATGKTLK
jgi:hypothetical protein